MQFWILVASFVCASARIIPTTTDAEIIQYLNGLKVPDFSATIVHLPMRMEYTFSNTVLGHNAQYNVNYKGVYVILDNSIRITLVADEGWITGHMKATAYYNDDPDFSYHMNGDFQLHAINSTIVLEILIPSFTSEKGSLIAMTFCNATYDKLIMDFNSTTFTNIEDKRAMDAWLSKSLHDTFSESYCLAIREDFKKGTKSAAVRGILRELLTVVFGGFITG